jgi:hypothetical protein
MADSKSPIDQNAQNIAGTVNAATTQYLNNLGGMAPNAAALGNSMGYNALANQAGALRQAGSQYAPFQGQAGDAQNQAFQQYMNMASGQGPSLAALQQAQALQGAQGAGAAVASQDPSRSGGSAASQFLAMMGTQQNAANQALGQGAQARLGESAQALQGAGGVSNSAFANQLGQSNNNIGQQIGIANYLNAVGGNAAKADLGAQQAGLDYLQGLGAASTGGFANQVNSMNAQNQLAGAIVGGLGSALGGASSAFGKPGASPAAPASIPTPNFQLTDPSLTFGTRF